MFIESIEKELVTDLIIVSFIGTLVKILLLLL